MQRGFSLIELLVVIAIIAVLAGMLLPAAGLVRDAAKEVRCTGHLRQLQIASSVYASDEDGALHPSHFNYPAGAGNKFWIGWIAPYLDASKNDSTAYNKVFMTSVVWGCPSFTKNSSFPTSCGYGMNLHLESDMMTNYRWDDQPVDSNGYIYKVFALARIGLPANRPLFADSSNWSLPASAGDRHRGRRSVVYFDGHTDLQTWSRIGALIGNPQLP